MQGLLFRIIALTAMATWLSACGDDKTVQPTSEPVAQVEPTSIEAAPEPTATAVAKASPTSETSPTPDAVGIEALAVVEAFDPVDETAGISSLNELIFNDREVDSTSIVPSLAPLLVDEDATRRWAALYVVALVTDTDDEIDVLRMVLGDPELSFRVEAAGSLVGLGVMEALPVLIDGLDDEWDMPYSHPPQAVAEHARTTLEYYTGETFTDAAGWQSWWESVKDTIRWDGERYVAS